MALTLSGISSTLQERIRRRAEKKQSSADLKYRAENWRSEKKPMPSMGGTEAALENRRKTFKTLTE